MWLKTIRPSQVFLTFRMHRGWGLRLSLSNRAILNTDCQNCGFGGKCLVSADIVFLKGWTSDTQCINFCFWKYQRRLWWHDGGRRSICWKLTGVMTLLLEQLIGAPKHWLTLTAFETLRISNFSNVACHVMSYVVLNYTPKALTHIFSMTLFKQRAFFCLAKRKDSQSCCSNWVQSSLVVLIVATCWENTCMSASAVSISELQFWLTQTRPTNTAVRRETEWLRSIGKHNRSYLMCFDIWTWAVFVSYFCKAERVIHSTCFPCKVWWNTSVFFLTLALRCFV